MKPRIFAIVPGLIPSTIINVITPVVDLHRAGQIIARIAMEPYVNEKDFEWCDLVILCRNTDPQTGQWFLKLLQTNKPYIYDIDDNFFELSANTIAGKYHKAPERINLLREYIRRADLVRVYSGPMVAQTQNLNPKVVKLTGPVDWRLLANSQKASGDNLIKIVYATSRVNDTLSDLFKPSLHRILEKYRAQIEVYFLGYNPPEFNIYPNVHYKPLTLNYERFLHYFSGTGFDIGLAPLLDDIFHRSKTNIKVREYGACHIAGIYSDVDVYSTSVIQRETGILVENTPQAWLNAMSELIENSELRNHIQEQAYRFAKENFSHLAFNQLWYQQINKILQQPKEQQEDYQSIIALFHPGSLSSNSSEKSKINESKHKQYDLPSISRKVWLYSFLKEKARRLVSGLKSEGWSYFMRTGRYYIETFWILAKIKLKLFFFSIKNSLG